jgi:hypothetical protein
MSRLDSKTLKPHDVVQFHYGHNLGAVTQEVDAVGFSAVLFCDGSSLHHNSSAWDYAKVYRGNPELPKRISCFELGEFQGYQWYFGGQDIRIGAEGLLHLADEINDKLGYLRKGKESRQ